MTHYAEMADSGPGGKQFARARAWGCLSRRQAFVMAAVGSVYLVAMVLVLALRAGPQPEVALVMLWPVLAHFALAAFYVFDVDVATRWLGKVPTAAAGAVVRESSGERVEGSGLFDPPAPVEARRLASLSSRSAAEGPAGPGSRGDWAGPSAALGGGRAARGSAGAGASARGAPEPSSRRPVVLCFGGGFGVCACCCVRGCRCLGAESSAVEPGPAVLDASLVNATDLCVGSEAAGTIWLPAVLALLPALLSQWAFWLARHLVSLPLVGERPYDAVAEGIYVGRWPIRFPSEFPAHCPNVVDLTAELPARADVIRGRRYACVPALDCTMPLPGALIAAAATVGGWPGGVYVHCANGHGRSACFAALLMVLRGESATWRAAVEQMKTVRPLVSVHGTQAALMDDVEASMRAAGMLPPLAAEGAVPAASPAVAAVEMAERERDAGAGSD